MVVWIVGVAVAVVDGTGGGPRSVQKCFAVVVVAAGLVVAVAVEFVVVVVVVGIVVQ